MRAVVVPAKGTVLRTVTGANGARSHPVKIKTHHYFAFRISVSMSGLESSRTKCAYFSPAW